MKGQASIEALVLIAGLLLALAIAFSINVSRMEKLDFMKKTGIEKNDCLKLQSALLIVQASQKNAQLEVETAFDANLGQGFIQFENYYCEVPGSVANAILSKGKILVKKVDGAVLVENA